MIYILKCIFQVGNLVGLFLMEERCLTTTPRRMPGKVARGALKFQFVKSKVGMVLFVFCRCKSTFLLLFSVVLTNISPCLHLHFISSFLWLYTSWPDYTWRAVFLPQSHQCSREAEVAGGTGNSQSLPDRQSNKARKRYLDAILSKSDTVHIALTQLDIVVKYHICLPKC